MYISLSVLKMLEPSICPPDLSPLCAPGADPCGPLYLGLPCPLLGGGVGQWGTGTGSQSEGGGGCRLCL